MSIPSNIASIRTNIPEGVTLVCVSKFHPAEAIMQAYDAGERDFGESRVQELLPKYEVLPKDIRWHFIGHLQTNKVKQIIPFVHMIHSVDSVRLLETINREAEKIGRHVKVLLEVHVAKEETKSGFTPEELSTLNIQHSTFNYVEICGLMGMATNTDDQAEWRRCFREIHSLASKLITSSPHRLIASSPISHSSPSERPQISMGMSDDYLVAIEEGSTMVRIGSTIFGSRGY
jgi:pyridoxal phosphate enzyme (YggS family)